MEGFGNDAHPQITDEQRRMRKEREALIKKTPEGILKENLKILLALGLESLETRDKTKYIEKLKAIAEDALKEE